MAIPLKLIGTSSEVVPKHRKKFYSNDESSTESLLSMQHSGYNETDTELSSESDKEEHAYCLQKKNKVKILKRKYLPENIDIHNQSKRPKCNSKNAVMARMNRMKKKKYIEDIEIKNAELKEQNKLLKDLLDKRIKEVDSLRRESFNLRNVIRNRTEIGSLLKCIHQNTNLQISSSLLKEMSTDVQVSGSDSHTTSRPISNVEEPTVQDEAFVAAVVWGMALHTFCQPYSVT